jgi:TniQ
MSISILSGARLLFRVDPLPRESPREYLCRVAEAHGYWGPLALAQIAGLPTSGLERDDSVKQIAHVLRLEPEEWQAMHYRHIGGRNRFDQRSFYGQRISVDDLNYERPRICPRCLKEAPIWWAVWDLGLVTACPIHRCHLVNQCPACKRRLAWQRPSVHKCRCGLDLRALTAEVATPDLVAINAAIYKAAGFPPGEGAELDLVDRGFPPEMLRLSLGALLRLVLFVGSIHEKNKLRRKQRPFAATDIAVATEIDRGADAVLRAWPRPLREVLRNMLPPGVTDPASLNFSKIFGNFYRHLFRVLPRSEFGFLHDVFESFVIEDWKGLIRAASTDTFLLPCCGIPIG